MEIINRSRHTRYRLRTAGSTNSGKQTAQPAGTEGDACAPSMIGACRLAGSAPRRSRPLSAYGAPSANRRCQSRMAWTDASRMPRRRRSGVRIEIGMRNILERVLFVDRSVRQVPHHESLRRSAMRVEQSKAKISNRCATARIHPASRCAYAMVCKQILQEIYSLRPLSIPLFIIFILLFALTACVPVKSRAPPPASRRQRNAETALR